MMKKIIIEVVVTDDKMATAFKTTGFDRTKLLDNFEILGVLEHLKKSIDSRISELARKEFD